MDQKQKSAIQENLLALYLRLNGYFTTGLIVHSSEKGKNRTEIDSLAVRFPYNSEPQREILPSKYIKTSCQYVDLLICEVKSRGQQLRFNENLYKTKDALIDVLRWAGMFKENDVLILAKNLQSELAPNNLKKNKMPEIVGPDYSKTRIRGVLCSPERWEKRNNQNWFINGKELFDYIHKCLRPSIARSKCSTKYDYTLWTPKLEPIVKYFKKQDNIGRINNLYSFIEKDTNCL